MNSLSAVPVVLAGYRVPPSWKGRNHWVVGRRFLYYSGYDAHRILFLARLPTIALFAALCIVDYWFVLRQTASRAWALAAAALTGFCPNLMAHGRLATVDLALTFFAFSATVLLFRVLDRPTTDERNSPRHHDGRGADVKDLRRHPRAVLCRRDRDGVRVTRRRSEAADENAGDRRHRRPGLLRRLHARRDERRVRARAVPGHAATADSVRRVHRERADDRCLVHAWPQPPAISPRAVSRTTAGRSITPSRSF